MSFADWLEKINDEETVRFAGTLAQVFLARAGGSGTNLSQAITDRRWGDVLSFDPPMDMGPDLYYNLAQAKACFSKLACLPTGIDTEAVAYAKFLDGERKCGIYNRIFDRRASGSFAFEPDVEAILHGSARKIAEILGDVPEMNRVPLRISVGGATTTTKKKVADLRNLIAGCYACSEELWTDLPKLEQLCGELPHLFPCGEDEMIPYALSVQTGMLRFVRKNAKEDRPITVEPPLNKMVQNGYGDIMRDRLKRYGCDLTDSERQNELSRLGSLYDRIATIDLTNASGLICNGLVLDQFPEPWLDVMYWCRTGSIYGPHGLIELQSFAGMGNGITFPLESILFQAICDSVCDYMNIQYPISSVYGDDICISVEAVPLLYKVFGAIGLQVNESKSFISGPFREACGTDWYCGYDVRPIYIRDNISKEDLYSLHNQYAARGDTEVCDIILRYLNTLNDRFLRGPKGFGDGHLHVENWKDFCTFRLSDGYSGWDFSTYRHLPLVNYTVTAFDSVVPLAMNDSATQSRLLICNPDVELAQEIGVAGSLFLSRQFMTRQNWSKYVKPHFSMLSRLCRESLRNEAINFEPALAELPVQTPRERGRRNWKVKFQGVERPPQDLHVFGTPLPGSRGVEEQTLYILGL